MPKITQGEMDKKRWLRLEMGNGELTEEEIRSGWHFCMDWDFMLVGPGMQELKACGCLDPAIKHARANLSR